MPTPKVRKVPFAPRLGRRITDIKSYIEKNSVPVTETGCWLWFGSSDKCGYGVSHLINGSGMAHRTSYAAFKGEIPDGMFVCHKCDTPSCVNPEHLFIGSASENNKDMRDKGRSSFKYQVGSKHHSAKLNEKCVIQIRERAKAGESLSSIARSIGMKYGTVYSAAKGISWAHVKETSE